MIWTFGTGARVDKFQGKSKKQFVGENDRFRTIWESMDDHIVSKTEPVLVFFAFVHAVFIMLSASYVIHVCPFFGCFYSNTQLAGTQTHRHTDAHTTHTTHAFLQ